MGLRILTQDPEEPFRVTVKTCKGRIRFLFYRSGKKVKKSLKKDLTGHIDRVTVAYTTMWEIAQELHLSIMDTMNTLPKIANSEKRDSESMMMCCMSMCLRLGKGGAPM